MKKLKQPSLNENEAINAALTEDPDTWEASDFTKAKRGRPFAEQTKQPVSLRLDPEVVTHFKKDGRGWQGRINEVLREAAGLR